MQRIKEIHPDGMVRLAGYSFGTSVAIEMALQLQQEGSDVQSLILLDGSHAYATAYVDRVRDQLADTAFKETLFICFFVNSFAFRFANSDEVCVTLKSRDKSELYYYCYYY